VSLALAPALVFYGGSDVPHAYLEREGVIVVHAARSCPRETLKAASPDVLREMIKGFAQRMMDADVEVRCNAGYGEVTPERVNSRNGYRIREWDTRAGTDELAIPRLRQGSYFPEFL
jgi:putative transposase